MAVPDRATLAVTFEHPPAAFLYASTAPCLSIDGDQRAVPGWGTHRFTVPPGHHALAVWVPYAIPRRAGRATTEVDLGAGETLTLRYMAPTITFLRGALGSGAQTSAGRSTVLGLTVAAVLVVLAIGAYLLTR